VLNNVRALQRRVAADVLARIDPTHVAEIDNALAVSWIPFAAHIGVLEAARSVLGPVSFRGFSRDFIREALQSSALFAKQAAYVLTMVDGGAWSLVRAIPVSCRLVFSGAGEVIVESADGDRTAKVIYDGLPAEHARNDVWSLSWLGTIDALAARALERFDRTAIVEETRCDPDRGFFEWTARIVKKG